MDPALIVGNVASICSMTSFVPKAWKIIKTGDTQAISKRMYAVTVVGFALWSVCGAMRMEWPIITNTVCFCLSAFILKMKILPPDWRETVSIKLGRRKR